MPPSSQTLLGPDRVSGDETTLNTAASWCRTFSSLHVLGAPGRLLDGRSNKTIILYREHNGALRYDASLAPDRVEVDATIRLIANRVRRHALVSSWSLAGIDATVARLKRDFDTLGLTAYLREKIGILAQRLLTYGHHRAAKRDRGIAEREAAAGQVGLLDDRRSYIASARQQRCVTESLRAHE